jgi:hypothetical protein
MSASPASFNGLSSDSILLFRPYLGILSSLTFSSPLFISYSLDDVAATSTIHCVFSLRSVRLPGVWDINHTLLLLSTASLISLFLRTKCYWYLWLFYIYSPSYRCMHLPIFILSSIHPCSAYWFGPLSPAYGISDILGRSMTATFQLTTWILFALSQIILSLSVFFLVIRYSLFRPYLRFLTALTDLHIFVCQSPLLIWVCSQIAITVHTLHSLLFQLY